MAIDPAAISAKPAVMMMLVASTCTAPDRPAASAKGTVRPSAMPMTISRTVSDAVKCFSTCGVTGIGNLAQECRAGYLSYGISVPAGVAQGSTCQQSGQHVVRALAQLLGASSS